MGVITQRIHEENKDSQQGNARHNPHFKHHTFMIRLQYTQQKIIVPANKTAALMKMGV